MLAGLIIILIAIPLDQITKFIATSTLVVNGPPKVIIPGLLQFQLIYNKGASFGFMEGQQLFFAIVTIISLLLFGYFFIQSDFKKKKIYTISIALFIAGTLGNAIDRIFIQEGVIDMINVPLIPLFATFNFADAYLNIAIVLFIIDLLFLERTRTNENKKI